MSNFVEIKVSEIVCKLDSIYWAGSVWSSIVLVRNIGGYWGARGSFRGNAGGSIQFLSGGGRAFKYICIRIQGVGTIIFSFFESASCLFSIFTETIFHNM